jgi:hypothetical protein
VVGHVSFILKLASVLKLLAHLRSHIYETPVETGEDLVGIIIAAY